MLQVVIAQCLKGCESILTTVDLRSDKTHACDHIPAGVGACSARTSLETFGLKEGYYRVSADSRIVLECCGDNNCSGSAGAENYCATGYEGPSKSSRVL